jgi:SAM-dependent methyltransferase
MKRSKYQRYQDYVIRDGRLVGEFEEMYQDYPDPWDQSKHGTEDLDKVLGVELLKKFGHKKPLEYGCGLGQYTNVLYRALGDAAGMDISATAITKAKSLYPGPTFFVGDLLNAEPLAQYEPDVLVFSQITWYVLEKLEPFKKILGGLQGRAFLHLLEVYAPGAQSYGRDYFVDLDGILHYWSDVVDFEEWGIINRRIDNGGGRTFFYGTIRSGT